tara:strand:- start:3402 stop:4037 length:636 start_codon:yes stop_codon:yes gene_type:complete
LNSPYLIGTLSFLLIALNHYVLIGEKFKLQKSEGDKSFDPSFNRLFLHLASGFILLLNIGYGQRVLLLSLDLWSENSFVNTILNFLSFNPNFQTNLAGFLLFTFGFILRIYAIRTLGPFFTFEVGLRKSHQLITKGPYSIIRHPGYLGYILISIGLYTFLGSFFGIILSFTICSLIYFKRIPIEENILSKKFGDEFEKYKLKTKKIIPFIY